uniref:Protein kinase domain-containing protein n=1 Tax=Physcomitrium patens TaxID=3218 RepID=A0A2K1JIM3_PHYPA|nr:hypothetical protein PHYPA_018805 [Physcomitrium patens]
MKEFYRIFYLEHGLVFKGTLSNGTVVPVKKSTRDVSQVARYNFVMKSELLSRLKHKHLVRLVDT